LLQLEHGENGLSGMERAETGQLPAQNQLLQQENSKLSEQLRSVNEQLEQLRNTKLFRWASPARDVYARLRRPR